MLSLQREIDHYELEEQRRCNVIAQFVIDGESNMAEAYAEQYPSLQPDIERLRQNSVEITEDPARREVEQTEAVINFKRTLFYYISERVFCESAYRAYTLAQAVADIQCDLDWETFTDIRDTLKND